MGEQIQNQMQDRVANGLDPLTGEPIQTVGGHPRPSHLDTDVPFFSEATS